MKNKASDFDDFLIATVLADLFDPTDSDNLEYVSEKIVEGLFKNGILKNYDNDEEELIAS